MMFFGVIILLVVVYFLFKDQMSGKFDLGNSEKDSSLKQLDAKFINGDIDEATYLRMKSLINQR